MSAISPCLLGVGFLMSMVFTMSGKHESVNKKAYLASLTPEQSQVYQEVVDEREGLYYKGLCLGTLLGGLYMYFYGLGGQGLVKNACLFTTIVMATMTFFYMLMPKSKWMVNYLTHPAQIELWRRVYREMSYRYYLGFALGIVGYLLIGYALAVSGGEVFGFELPAPVTEFADEFF